MKNFNTQPAKPAEQVYQVIIDGVVYRGSQDYIRQVIKEDRENRR